MPPFISVLVDEVKDKLVKGIVSSALLPQTSSGFRWTVQDFVTWVDPDSAPTVQDQVYGAASDPVNQIV